MNNAPQGSELSVPEALSAHLAELESYHRNLFDLSSLGPQTRLPLPDEPFVAFWGEVVEQSRARGAFAVLRERLPQLAFPIRAGISETAPYRAATRQGVPTVTLPDATGLELQCPEGLEVVLHASPAGRIPLLIAQHREDFVTLVQALARRNEPEPIPAAQGALMVSGYNNWWRIAELRRSWEAQDAAAREAATWDEELGRLQPRRELYQDRFILLSDGPYSAVPASDLGLGEEEWRTLSLLIRRDHECAHYLTRRLFGSMRNHLLDELMADYAGLVGALGHFRADWFLRFLGLEEFPRYRQGGRLDLYRGNSPLGDGAFQTLHHQVHAAALHLQRFDETLPRGSREPIETAWTLAVLASFRLDELAAEGADGRLERAVAELRARMER